MEIKISFGSKLSILKIKSCSRCQEAWFVRTSHYTCQKGAGWMDAFWPFYINLHKSPHYLYLWTLISSLHLLAESDNNPFVIKAMLIWFLSCFSAFWLLLSSRYLRDAFRHSEPFPVMKNIWEIIQILNFRRVMSIQSSCRWRKRDNHFHPRLMLTNNKSGILRERIKPLEEFCTFENMLIFLLLLVIYPVWLLK